MASSLSSTSGRGSLDLGNGKSFDYDLSMKTPYIGEEEYLIISQTENLINKKKIKSGIPSYSDSSLKNPIGNIIKEFTSAGQESPANWSTTAIFDGSDGKIGNDSSITWIGTDRTADTFNKPFYIDEIVSGTGDFPLAKGIVLQVPSVDKTSISYYLKLNNLDKLEGPSAGADEKNPTNKYPDNYIN